MRIALLSLQLGADHRFTGYTHDLPPLGLCYLAATLLQHGHEVKVQDLTVPAGELSATARDVLAWKPDVVGLSLMSENYQTGIDFLRLLKAQAQVVTIIGGAHVNALPKQAVSPDCVDFGIWGEGEYALRDLADAGFDRQAAQNIAGVILKDDAGQVIMPKAAALVEELDSLPLPARQLVAPLDRYRPSILTYKKLPASALFTSRGCYAKCIFCTSGKGGNRLRFHSPEYVMKEIDELWNVYGIRELVFLDDTFASQKSRALEICEAIRTRFPTLSWSAQSRVDTLDEELLVAMRASGCWSIQIGVESGSQTILDNLRKGIRLEQVEAVTKAAYKLGFIIKGYFILGSPGETQETLNETIAFMRKLPLHYASINMLVPLPGTELWDKATVWGDFDADRFANFNYLSGEPVFVPKGMSARELSRAFERAYRSFYFSPATIWRNLKTIRTAQDVRKYSSAALLLAKTTLAGLLGASR